MCVPRRRAHAQACARTHSFLLYVPLAHYLACAADSHGKTRAKSDVDARQDAQVEGLEERHFGLGLACIAAFWSGAGAAQCIDFRLLKTRLHALARQSAFTIVSSNTSVQRKVTGTGVGYGLIDLGRRKKLHAGGGRHIVHARPLS